MTDPTEAKPAEPGPNCAGLAEVSRPDLGQMERSFDSIAELEASVPTIGDLEAAT